MSEATQDFQRDADRRGEQSGQGRQKLHFAVPDKRLIAYAQRNAFASHPVSPLQAHKTLALLPCQQTGSRLRFGWVQPLHEARPGFYLGMFPDAHTFVPFAFADDRGNVHTLEGAPSAAGVNGTGMGVAEGDNPAFDDATDIVMSLVRHDATEDDMEPSHMQESFAAAFGSDQIMQALEDVRGDASQSAKKSDAQQAKNTQTKSQQTSKQSKRPWLAAARRHVDALRVDRKHRAERRKMNAAAPMRPIESGYLITWSGEASIRLARVKKMPDPKRPGARGTYEMSEFRQPLPAASVRGLDYRDMMTLGFFALFLLPQMAAAPTGWGVSAILARLHTEAAFSALRHSAIDIMESQAAGWNVSAAEIFFVHVMDEAGVLGVVMGLEAEHGKEKLMLGRDRASGMFMLVSDAPIGVRQMLASCRIEGAINRFFNVATVLEWNRHFMTGPIEASASARDIAQIDADLLSNPALLALPPADDRAAELLPIRSRAGIGNCLALARKVGARLNRRAMDAYPQMPAHRPAHSGGGASGEWAYRQALSGLLTGLQLPYRYLTQFHSDVSAGCVALGVTAVSRELMPATRYDEATGANAQLSDAERNRMATAYSLRVGMIAAAAALGASDAIDHVQVQIDSVGLGAAVRQQDAAALEFADTMARTLGELSKGATNLRDGKGSPKDGDVHGDTDVSVTFPMSAPQSFLPHESASGDAHGADHDADHDAAAQDSAAQDAAVRKDASQDDASQSDADAAENAGDSSIVDGVAAASADAVKRVVTPPEPKLVRLVTVSFSRAAFLTLLDRYGLGNPVEFYKAAGASMEISDDGDLVEQPVLTSWSDSRFTPSGAQEEPEIAGITFDEQEAQIFGASDSLGLSIQRADVLEGASERFSELSRAIADGTMMSVEAAKEASDMIQRIGDPELNDLSPRILSSLIDGEAIQPLSFTMGQRMRTARVASKDLLFSGNIEEYVKRLEEEIAQEDEIFAGDAVRIPRYFNSYAERVVYNKLFARDGEKTLLIPDDLFYAHFELGQLLSQFSDSQTGLEHLNKAVSYAPTYPMAHLQQSIQFARSHDWDSARASALNALRITLDRDDAAFAYYRYAYSEWMHDEYAVAAAAYIYSDAIHPSAIPALSQELEELRTRMELQAMPIPHTLGDAVQVLREADVLIWPDTDVAHIVQSASVLAVNRGLFVPARTLAMAAARMRLFGRPSDGIDGAQALFIGSLNA